MGQGMKTYFQRQNDKKPFPVFGGVMLMHAEIRKLALPLDKVQVSCRAG